MDRAGDAELSEYPAGAAREIAEALDACDFPLVVWDLAAAVVRLANYRAAELFGRSLAGLVGTRASELIVPADAVERTITMVRSGVIDDVHAEREARSAAGQLTPVKVWTRAIQMDGTRAAVSLAIPVGEVGRLGRDPGAPWRELQPVAVGVTDSDLRVTSVSNDVRDVLHIEPVDLVGMSLRELFDLPDRVGPLEEASVVHRQTRFERADGTRFAVCLLVAPAGASETPRAAFALIGPADEPHARSDRIAELEMHLRVIGAEVRAARVLEDVGGMPSAADHPELRELTARQWEILSRLLRGERVQGIAVDMFIGPSTVRNHLTAIFRRFRVHSQAELLAVLRGPPRV